MKPQAPYTRIKDYDHDDVETDFSFSFTDALFDLGLAISFFVLLVCAIVFLANVPDQWVTSLLFLVGGA